MSREHGRRSIGAVGVVLPVNDEEKLLPAALQAIEVAVDALSTSISTQVVVVLDCCGDASSAIAHRWGARFGALVIQRRCRSVGQARRAGSLALLSRWAEKDPERIWLATTDADSRVPPHWLTVQLEAHARGTDMWAGRVRVAEKTPSLQRWTERYSAEPDPVHGANLGFSASAYTLLGGFGGMRSGEDRDLHRRAAARGFRITYDLRAPVTTSSRQEGRAPEGFAGMLRKVEQEQLEATA